MIFVIKSAIFFIFSCVIKIKAVLLPPEIKILSTEIGCKGTTKNPNSQIIH